MSITLARPAHDRRAFTRVITRSDASALEHVFLDWLRGSDKPQQVRIGGSEVPPTQLTWVLEMVADVERLLPEDLAEVLGLPAGTTVGAAARELSIAVNDSMGPRCRSYRAAAQFLHDRRELEQIFRDL